MTSERTTCKIDCVHAWSWGQGAVVTKISDVSAGRAKPGENKEQLKNANANTSVDIHIHSLSKSTCRHIDIAFRHTHKQTYTHTRACNLAHTSSLSHEHAHAAKLLKHTRWPENHLVPPAQSGKINLQAKSHQSRTGEKSFHSRARQWVKGEESAQGDTSCPYPSERVGTARISFSGLGVEKADKQTERQRERTEWRWLWDRDSCKQWKRKRHTHFCYKKGQKDKACCVQTIPMKVKLPWERVCVTRKQLVKINFFT